jgi:indolepyruvate ferredoxin oxidoreductase
MALSQPALRTPTFSHMGGEGLQWVGAAPFSATEHVFQNLGDGTYQHSGVLAIRAAVAAGANITFKILFNDAVAMTGGQPAEGAPDPVRILRQLEAEGVRAMALVSETPERWRDATGLPARARLLDRDALDEVQRDFRQTPGVTAIVYDQTCAAEKRRRRKRGLLETPSKRLYINPRVCEGCGDCSRASSCISIEPIETEFGAKRRINQSQCNLDFSCVQGFCPSFVELEAPVLKRPDPRRLEAMEAQAMGALPDPPERRLDRPYNIYIGGIGGLGVLTLGAILGAAAHIDGKIATVLDFTGLAQKNGAVVSQVRIAPVGRPIHAARIGASQADLLLGVDAVVGSATDAMRKIARGRTAAILNSDVAPTSDAVSDRDAALPKDQMIEAVLEVCDPHASEVLSATQITLGLFGDAIATNTFLLGLAFQRGLIPLSEAAILAAIEANGAAVALNLRAFRWGRLAVVNRERVEGIASVPAAAAEPTLAEFIARRVEDLTAYQDAAYARRYHALVDRALAAAGGGAMDGGRFARAVARGAYKLMAYKDEYEVARLYSESTFRDGLDAQFSGYRKLSVWLAPPLLSSKDPATGRPRKRRFGPWIFPLLRGLAALKGLRGSWADPFGHTRERRLERQLAEAYGRMIERLCADLGPETLDAAVALADLPQEIRGFGLVKEAAAEAALARFSEAGLPKPPPAYRIHRPTPESSRVAA